jgi:hypothetical protein
MRRQIGLLSLGVLLAATGSAGAQVIVRVPFVRVDVGAPPPRPVVVVEPVPPPVVVVPQPPPAVIVTPAPQPTVVLTRPQSHYEFARTFAPAPGTYDVVLVNPRTNVAARVNFTLPPGHPRVVAERNGVLFEYLNHHKDVEIRFPIGGQVRVIYH